MVAVKLTLVMLKIFTELRSSEPTRLVFPPFNFKAVTVMLECENESFDVCFAITYMFVPLCIAMLSVHVMCWIVAAP